MNIGRTVAGAATVCALTILCGCNSGGGLSQSDLDAVKNHQHTEMPADAKAKLADQQKKGTDLYLERMKEHGMQVDSNNQRVGFGSPGQPAPAAPAKK